MQSIRPGIGSRHTCASGRGVGVFVAVNKIDFGVFAGLTAGAHALVASLAPY